MDPSQVKIPPMKDLNADNITENTIRINSQGPDERLTYVLERLVTHLHDFARETRLSSEEWMAGLNFLTKTGQTCSDVRQEFILLSDILGLSLLVDSISHPKPAHSTEGSLLGPFHVHAPPVLQNGEELSHDANGDPCLVVCTIKDSAGRPIAGVNIDIWETDSSGHYDVQHADRDGPDGRCVMTSDAKGEFWFKAIRPVSYPIPHDGPVGQLLKKLHRHPWRPAHMHFMFSAPGYDNLITALYIAGDPYITSDAVFGVKTSLIKEIGTVDGEYAERYGVPEGTGLLEYGFVLVSEEETLQLRDGLARREWERLFPGRKVKLVDNLPVPDLD